MEYPSWTNGTFWHVDEEGNRSFIRSRYKVPYGGRASTKSWTAAQVMIELCNSMPLRCLCSREVQKSIKDSSKKLLEDTIVRFGLKNRFKVTDTYILNKVTGATIVFHGLKDTDSIKSMEGIDIVWIEEGESVSEESIEDVFPTIRKAQSEIWVTFNPKSEDAPIYKMFVTGPVPPRAIVVKVNYTDNPWASEETLADALHCKLHFPDKYRHIWEGFPKTSSNEYTVLPIEMLRRCIDAHKIIGNDSGQAYAGMDVAPSIETSGDANSLAIRKGPTLRMCNQWQSDDQEAIVNSAITACKAAKTRILTFDSIGVGGFFEKPLKRKAMGTPKINPFMGGSKVFQPNKKRLASDGRKIKNRDFFSNAKAQQWWNLRDRLETTISLLDGQPVEDATHYLSISSEVLDVEELIKELSQATYEHDMSGRIKIDKAPSDRYIEVDGKKKKVKSPNRADSVGYAYVSDFCNSQTTSGPMMGLM